MTSAQLDHIRELWEDAARENAQWYILTAPMTREAFLEQGRIEIAATLDTLIDRGIGFGRNRALDFGCGMGRLTLALARYYAHVDGVDIAEEMISRAYPHPKITYHRLDSLETLPGEYDLIYSDLVLQHMPSRLQEPYVKDFVRLLSEDGVAVFDIPEGLIDPGDVNSPNPLSMWNANPQNVADWVSAVDGKLLDCDPRGTKMPGVVSNRYIVMRDI